PAARLQDGVAAHLQNANRERADHLFVVDHQDRFGTAVHGQLLRGRHPPASADSRSSRAPSSSGRLRSVRKQFPPNESRKWRPSPPSAVTTAPRPGHCAAAARKASAAVSAVTRTSARPARCRGTPNSSTVTSTVIRLIFSTLGGSDTTSLPDMLTPG